MTGGALEAPKPMRLRYGGRCRQCAVDLAAGTDALYDGESKTVTCVSCAQRGTADPAGPATPAPMPTSALQTADQEIFAGTPGASARREYERRSSKRETRIRENHPVMGGLILALTENPQSTNAWAVGARGEERLGRRLDGLRTDDIRVLHDRRIPPTNANIDHIVVCPSGVTVIDAKRYKGRPRLRVEGGILRPRVECLTVGSRNCATLVDEMRKQIALVEHALKVAAMDHVPVKGMLCFVEADWPLLGGAFTIGGVHVLWPAKAADHIRRPGRFDAAATEAVYRTLARAFPSA